MSCEKKRKETFFSLSKLKEKQDKQIETERIYILNFL